MLQFGEKIKKLRKEAHMSQQELADNLFVSQQAVYKWEHGYSLPSADKILDISKVFNVSCLDLMYDNNVKNQYIDIDYTEKYLEMYDAIQATPKGDILKEKMQHQIKSLRQGKRRLLYRLTLTPAQNQLLLFGIQNGLYPDVISFWKHVEPDTYALHLDPQRFL